MEMVKVELELPRDLLGALNLSPIQLGRKTKEALVLELFREGQISAGKGAEILGLTKIQFIDLLARRGIPYLDMEPGELAEDVAAAEAARERR